MNKPMKRSSWSLLLPRSSLLLLAGRFSPAVQFNVQFNRFRCCSRVVRVWMLLKNRLKAYQKKMKVKTMLRAFEWAKKTMFEGSNNHFGVYTTRENRKTKEIRSLLLPWSLVVSLPCSLLLACCANP